MRMFQSVRIFALRRGWRSQDHLQKKNESAGAAFLHVFRLLKGSRAYGFFLAWRIHQEKIRSNGEFKMTQARMSAFPSVLSRHLCNIIWSWAAIPKAFDTECTLLFKLELTNKIDYSSLLKKNPKTPKKPTRKENLGSIFGALAPTKMFVMTSLLFRPVRIF